MSDYDQIRLIMERELALYKSDELETIRESCDEMVVPDYFNYGAAADAYDAGRCKRADFKGFNVSLALQTYASTNIVELAYLDGLSANWLFSTLSSNKAVQVIRERDIGRAVVNHKFYRRFVGQDKCGVRECQTDNLQSEYMSEMRDCQYSQLWYKFKRGYKDAFVLFMLTGKFPYGCAYYCDLPYPGESPQKRAYVYGWWCGGLDYFIKDDTVYRTCKRGINRFRLVESAFFEFCSAVDKN